MRLTRFLCEETLMMLGISEGVVILVNLNGAKSLGRTPSKQLGGWPIDWDDRQWCLDCPSHLRPNPDLKLRLC
ncbi:hypothetical protein FH972_004511 [Carpinus fangiana]|uniref:Uncharacterized protein n=1 Tax=Carpinus fangiana TaxID=176857 RepID=A0A5N6QLB0_9ROSI|nr:hypothetical protein FH972_004511 [Carpinus fangiana]